MSKIMKKLPEIGILVKNSATDESIELSETIQKDFLTSIAKNINWIENYVRTDGITPDDKSEEFSYSVRKKNVGGTMRAFDGHIIPSTKESDIPKTEVSCQNMLLFKVFFNIQDELGDGGISSFVRLQLQHLPDEKAKELLDAFKGSLVGTIGEIGEFAANANHVLPTTGIGKRVQNKTYPITAQGGLNALGDINVTLTYKGKIGLKDGVEVDYPFWHGSNFGETNRIIISPNINEAVKKAVEANGNQKLIGIDFNNETGILNSIAHDGISISVEVVGDMPAKSGKAFNWAIIEVGRDGALAFPIVSNSRIEVKPNFRGVSSFHRILEVFMLKCGFKNLQSELNFGSFEA